MDIFSELLIFKGTSFIFQKILSEVITPLIKGSLEDYVKDFFKGLIGESVEILCPDSLRKAAGSAIIEFLVLISNEFERADLGKEQQEGYETSLKRFIQHKDVKKALGAVFAPSAESPDSHVLAITWQNLKLNPLPDGFDWRGITKSYKIRVKRIIGNSPELKELLNTQNLEILARSTEIYPDFDLDKYAESLEEFYGYLRLDSLNSSGYEYRMHLWRMFIPQTLRESHPVFNLPKEILRQMKATGNIDCDFEDLERQKGKYLDCPTLCVLDYIKDHQCLQAVVTGDPGSGKSTLVQFIALDWVENRLSPNHQRLLPIVIELRKYAQDPNKPKDFLEYLHGGANTICCLERRQLDEYLTSGKAFVMFDGLDEVFDPIHQTSIASQIIRFSNDYKKTRILVTSRKIGYKSDFFRNANFKEFTIEDLDGEQIDEFCDRWHKFAFTLEEDRQKYHLRLTKAISESRAIRELSANPLLLTMMAILNRYQELPRERYKLYEASAELLLLNWDVQRQLIDAKLSSDLISTSEKQAMLRKVAYFLQSSSNGLGGNLIVKSELSKILIVYLKTLEGIRNPHEIANQIIRQLHERNFILCLYGGQTYGFVHRTFLEFFCASEFFDQIIEQQALSISDFCQQILSKHWQDPTWREVLRLLAGRLNEKFAAEMIRYLIDIPMNRQVYCDDLHLLNRSGIENLVFAAELLNEVRNRLPIANIANEVLEAIKAISQDNLHIGAARALAHTLNTVWQNDPAVSNWMKLVPKGLIDSSTSDELTTSAGTNLQNLRDLLLSGEWESANKETARLICELSDRQAQGWLDWEDFEKIPCADIQAIDRLWVKYSAGRFGFSTQKQVLDELACQKLNSTDSESFFEIVGWKDNKEDLMPHQIYSQKYLFAPKGMQPYGRGRWFHYDICLKLQACETQESRS